MKNKLFLKFLIVLSVFLFSEEVKANYWLVIGTYRQGPGGRPVVSGITSPSLHSIPMNDLEICKKAGKEISEKIFKPVWQFDSKWTCVFSGNK